MKVFACEQNKKDRKKIKELENAQSRATSTHNFKVILNFKIN